MFKRLAVLVLVIVMAASILAACGKADNSSDNGSTITSNVNGTPTDENDTSAGTSSDATAKDTAASASTYNAGVTVTPPAEWTKKEGSAVPTYVYKDGVLSFITTRDNMPSDAATSDAFVKFAQGQLKDVFENAVFTDTEKITVDGKEGVKYGYSCSSMGIKMDFRIVYVFKDGYAHTFTFGGLADEVANRVGDFDKFLDTAKFE